MNLWLDLSRTVGEALRTNPVLVLLLIVAPLLALACFRRVYPAMALLFWSLVPAAMTLSLVLQSDLYSLILAIDLAIVLLAAWDSFTLPSARSFSIERSCQRIASLRKNHRVILSLMYTGDRAQRVVMKDGVPQEFEVQPPEFRLTLDPRSRVTVHYDLKPTRRGAFALEVVHLRLGSRFGLWQRFLELPVRSIIHVYPDMKQVGEYALLARTNRLSLMGVRRTRRVGQDNEFERLRDYTLDDNYKHIDWRSTARRNKLTVKDFQTNQSQRVIFLIDCGRMMTNESFGISLLDHALNAMLMLSYVALMRGDSVGLLTFSDRIHSFVPPGGGRSQMNHLLHAAYDRFPQLVESRYREAYLYLSARCRKRSLVILVTNLIDEVNANQIRQYLGQLSHRHLPLGVLLRDHHLFDAAEVRQPTGSQLFRGAAAAEILCWRHEVLTNLQHNGVLVLDTFPEDMTAPLINKYLDIKARHLL